jgi:hypothetical protein
MKSTAFLAALLLATGCAVQTAPTLGTPDPVDPTPDAAAPTSDAPTTLPGSDVRTDAGGPEVSGPLDGGGVLRGDADAATPPAADGQPTPEAAPPSVDSGTDGASAPDATSPEAGVDVAVPDGAGGDAPPVGDAGPPGTDSGNADPVCTASQSPSCTGANAADQTIRETFIKPCTPEGLQMCGGITRGTSGVVETLPMVCRAGQWRLAGYWGGANWVALYTCSKGCGTAGKLCDP